MDVRHYFEPVDFSIYPENGPLKWNYTLGADIEKTTKNYNPDKTSQVDLAIIGIPFDSRIENSIFSSPDKIREELYQLASINKNLKIADFGDLKVSMIAKENYRAVRDLIEYFAEQNIVTIILGGSQDLTIGVCDAFQNNPLLSLSVVDAFLDIKAGVETLNSGNYLSHIFRNKTDIFQFNLIGYQSYYVPSAYFSKTKGINQHLRLGLLRENIELTEPIFRNSDIVSFDINSVQNLSLSDSAIFSPNGLRSEEACQLSRYAGIASKVKVFGLFETPADIENYPSLLRLTAQIIWYFIEGFNNRLPKNIRLNENNKVYRVEVENIDHPIVFVLDIQTGQWWMEVNSIHYGTHYFACSEEEYIQAKNNEIPELWLNYVQKTDKILK